jgi:hypothetical protein
MTKAWMPGEARHDKGVGMRGGKPGINKGLHAGSRPGIDRNNQRGFSKNTYVLKSLTSKYTFFSVGSTAKFRFSSSTPYPKR